jgi:hypothetical protein
MESGSSSVFSLMYRKAQLQQIQNKPKQITKGAIKLHKVTESSWNQPKHHQISDKKRE